jgi:hypothetical protein
MTIVSTIQLFYLYYGKTCGRWSWKVATGSGVEPQVVLDEISQELARLN